MALGPLNDFTKLLTRVPAEAQAFVAITRSGLVGPELPHRLLAMAQAMQRYGPYGAAVVVAALRDGDRPGLVDERGSLTFSELDRRSNALAHALRDRGVVAGTTIGILCRNHRGLFDAIFGTAKAGARAVFLSTDFAGPQATQVCSQEGVEVLIFDEEFTEEVSGIGAPKGRLVAWTETRQSATTGITLESLIATGSAAPPPAPGCHGKAVVLTSGTTGAPKGADRDVSLSLVGPGALLSKIPFRRGGATFIATPIFHSLGLGNVLLATALGSTMVVRRNFDAEATLVSVAEHHCTSLIVVPAILNRLVAVGDERIAQLDLSALRIILSSGSQLNGSLAIRALDTFGDTLYNLYGSTEVAWATIATPADLRAAPGTAGRVPLGTTVAVLDDNGHPVPAGATGRIFVGNGQEFSGYTGGGGREIVRGLMSIGDVGHFDGSGLLFVEGRDDDMIVSGGENVYPQEVEDLLASHASIAEAAAFGVPDEEFGERLRAFVVLSPGQRLSARAVKDFVRANLARSRVPRDVVFVDLLPRNPSGKVLKHELEVRGPGPVGDDVTPGADPEPRG